MDDYGMTAHVPGRLRRGAPDHFANLQQRFLLDVPAIDVRPVPPHVAGFLDGLSTDASVTKPVGDLYIGTHASGDGALFVKLFPGQVDANGDVTDVTDFEVLDQALGPARPARIEDALVGYVRATPPATDPAPTHSVHIKGCNIGRNRVLPAPGKPDAPFLVRLKAVFGDNVNVTAPMHFHGLLPETSQNGMFEYMAQEFVVRIKARPVGKRVKGLAKRADLVAAYKAAHFSYYDGTPIPDAAWEKIVPRRFRDNRGIATTLPLGRTVESISEVTVHKQLRITHEEILWTVSAPFPDTKPERLTLLRSIIAGDPRFDPAHDWPVHERWGYADADALVDGHLWKFAVRKNTLNCVGHRFDYTIVEPIVDRSVNPAAARPLIYNFYPGKNSTELPVLTGFVETDSQFFGRA
jgi:hypothetical protein